jgi:hypothetical protein
MTNVISIHSRNPARNPMNGPKATSTNAYGPPVNDTRLPASAMQMTMRLMAIAQSR